MKTILFYWSKGASTRRKIILYIEKCNKDGNPVHMATLASHLDISHSAIRKHKKLLLENGFVKAINPGGKPEYLELSEAGTEVVQELLEGKTGGWMPEPRSFS